MRETAVLLGGLVVALFLALGLSSIFSPAYEQVRNNTFHASQAYSDGQRQQLEGYYAEYRHGDADEKRAVLSIVGHEFASYDINSLSGFPELQSFLEVSRRDG